MADLQEVKKNMTDKMNGAVDHLKGELAGVRTGRASLALFDGISVNYYGTPTPLKQVATLAIPESRLITIQPWDPSQISEIEKAILSSGIGLTPSNDGKIVRIPIPQLTEERRRDLVKLVKKLCEESKVTIRGIRRDVNEGLKSLQKEGSLSEDIVRKSQEEAQKITDQMVTKVEEIFRKKEAEVMEV